MGNVIFTNPAERDRLKAFDGSLILFREIRDGNDNVIRSEPFLNTTRELERFLEIAEGLDEIAEGDPDEIYAKGVAAEQIAEAVYGSRAGYYTSRIKTAFHYDGDVSMRLPDHTIIDQVDGLIIRTRVTDHFRSAVNRTTAKTVDLTLKGINKNAKRFNDVTAMLARRNPEVAELVESSRSAAYGELTRQTPGALKALAPVKTTGNGSKKP